MRRKTYIAGLISALAAVVLCTPAAADTTVQPDPSGSVIADRLERDAEGTLFTNGSGGYFPAQPYIDNEITRKVGPIYVGEEFYTSGCTASVLDTDSGLLAITAEHCTNNITAGKTVKFSPAANGGGEPYGGWYIDKAFTSTELVDGAVPDVAVLVIRPREVAGERVTVADATGGGFGIAPKISAGARVNATLLGYPGPAPYNGVTMSACVGDYTYYPGAGGSAIRRVSDQTECWVGGGASGGPYLTQSSTPGVSADIITVLRSNGGSVIADVAPELVEDAESWALAAYGNG